MNVVALSGWGQPHDALKHVVPEAHHFAYQDYMTLESCLQNLGEAAKDADAIIGWSLGGQLALRAVAQGYAKPKRLVLVAVPFKFIAREDLPMGMSQVTYEQFRQNYAANPERTLNKSYALIAKEDDKGEYIQNRLHELRERVDYSHWLRWFDWLRHVDCRDVDFSGFPPTTIVHGDRDIIVEPVQSAKFAGLIPHARLDIWRGCGHAPHLHDPKRLRQHLEYTSVF